jgi:Tol biopolymer transport system component
LVEVGPDGPLGDVQGVAPSTDPHSISLSTDGKKLAYSKFQLKQNIWSIPIPSSEVLSISDAQPVTADNQVIETHDLSADGKFVVFDGTRLGNADIWRMPVEGGTAQLVVDLPQDAFGPVWSPDGTEIAFYSAAAEGAKKTKEAAIYVVSANGGDPLVIADTSRALDGLPRWSPDGLNIAFMSQSPAPRIWLVSRERVGDAWDDPVRLTDFFCLLYDWAPDGESLVCKSRSDLRMFGQGSPDALDVIVIISKTGEIVSRLDPDVPVARTLTEVRSLYPHFSADGSEIYFFRRPADEWGIWSMPVAGGELTKLVAFDDPTFTVLTHAWDNPLTVGPDRFYLTIAQYESDIWVMDLDW